MLSSESHSYIVPLYLKGHHRKGDGTNVRPGGWEGCYEIFVSVIGHELCTSELTASVTLCTRSAQDWMCSHSSADRGKVKDSLILSTPSRAVISSNKWLQGKECHVPKW